MFQLKDVITLSWKNMAQLNQDRIADIQSNFDNNLLSKLTENSDEILNPYEEYQYIM